MHRCKIKKISLKYFLSIIYGKFINFDLLVSIYIVDNTLRVFLISKNFLGLP